MTGEILDLIGAIFLFLGSVLSLGAAVGLLRFPDVVTRMHAGAKPQTLGLLFLVVGATLSIREVPAVTMGILIIAFQFLTVPVSTHMVARTAYRAGLVAKDSLVIDELADQVQQTQRPVPRPAGPKPKAKPDPTARQVDPADENGDGGRTGEVTGRSE
ncbi:monovalent cation/H(+) antiporter subunit G [Enemella sp. A6]|uniref:monovalent cation/H(+) antiporter subunit G n=1 Tax=Enemella sp. A6 TaxID=3440152 RepID=UPI003EBD0027